METYYKIRIKRNDGVGDIRHRLDEAPPNHDFFSAVKEMIEQKKISPITIKSIEIIKKEVKETVVEFSQELVDRICNFEICEILKEV